MPKPRSTQNMVVLSTQQYGQSETLEDHAFAAPSVFPTQSDAPGVETPKYNPTRASTAEDIELDDVIGSDSLSYSSSKTKTENPTPRASPRGPITPTPRASPRGPITPSPLPRLLKRDNPEEVSHGKDSEATPTTADGSSPAEETSISPASRFAPRGKSAYSGGKTLLGRDCIRRNSDTSQHYRTTVPIPRLEGDVWRLGLDGGADDGNVRMARKDVDLVCLTERPPQNIRGFDEPSDDESDLFSDAPWDAFDTRPSVGQRRPDEGSWLRTVTQRVKGFVVRMCSMSP